MKTNTSFRTLFLVAMLSFFATNAQPKETENYLAFSTGFDVRNSIVGSPATGNKPELDLIYQFEMISQNIDVNIGYERFNSIGFQKYTIGVGYHFPLYGRIGNKVIKTVLIPSIEPTIIDRWGNEWQTTSSHLTIGANIGLRWHLSDKTAVELQTNFLPRTDLKARYPELHNSVPIVTSCYLKFIYKIHPKNEQNGTL